jgi:iron complex transport system substrate-binding protein
MRSGGTRSLLAIWIAGCAAILSIALHPPSVIARAVDNNPPSRLAIYPPAVVAYLTAAENAGGLLAVSEAERELLVNGPFGEIFPSINDVSTLATTGGHSSVPSDPEQVLRLSPDRIVTWRWAIGGLDKLGTPITTLGSAEEIAIWNEMAAVAGRPARARSELSDFESKVSALEEDIAPFRNRSGPRAIIMWRSGIGSWRIATPRHQQMNYLLKLGVTNPLRQKFLQTRAGNVSGDLETILAINPDVIFLACCASIADTPQSLFDTPALRSVKAIKNRRVYKEPIGGARMDGLIEWPLLLRWYTELLYPELSHSFRADFKSAYRQTYGFLLSDRELNQIIFMKENISSLNYDRFAE